MLYYVNKTLYVLTRPEHVNNACIIDTSTPCCGYMAGVGGRYMAAAQEDFRTERKSDVGQSWSGMTMVCWYQVVCWYQETILFSSAGSLIIRSRDTKHLVWMNLKKWDWGLQPPLPPNWTFQKLSNPLLSLLLMAPFVSHACHEPDIPTLNTCTGQVCWPIQSNA